MQIIRLVGLFGFTLLFLSSCSDSPDGEIATDESNRRSVPAVDSAAWLADRLPERTLAYVRMPAWLDMLDGDAAHDAFAGEDVDRQLVSLANAVDENLIGTIPAQWQAVARLFATDAQSLELAILMPADGSAIPELLFSARLAPGTVDDFDRYSKSLADSTPQVQHLLGADDSGVVSMLAGPAPMFLRFDAATHRLTGIAGIGANGSAIVDLAETPANSVSMLQKSSGDSGRSLALFVDIEKLLAQYGAMIDPDTQAMLTTTHLDRAEYLWVSQFNAHGRAGIEMKLKMPKDVDWRNWIAASTAPPDGLRIVGRPNFIARVTTPSAGAIDLLLQKLLSGDDDGEFAALLAEIEESMGHSVSELVTSFGSDSWIVSDRAGLWYASRVADQALADKTLASLADLDQFSIEQIDMGGTAIQHGLLDVEIDADDLGDEPEWFSFLFKRFRSHVYWTRDGEFLVSAALPQILADRNVQANGEIDDLLDDLDLNWDSVAFGIATESRGLAQKSYYTSLELLQFLADTVDAEFDITAFPSAATAELPENGRTALELVSDDDHIGLMLQLETGPLDAMHSGGSAAAVATVGILAAIAVPAYQDYTVRAKVAEAIMSTQPARLTVVEHYLIEEELPLASDMEDVLAFDQFYDEETGSIGFELRDITGGKIEGTVWMQPYAGEGGGIQWQCTSEGDVEKYLPASCSQ